MYPIQIIDFFIDRIIGLAPRSAGVELPALLAVCEVVSGESDLVGAIDEVQARLVERGYLRA